MPRRSLRVQTGFGHGRHVSFRAGFGACQEHRVFTINLHQARGHPFGGIGRHGVAEVVRLDGQFASAPIHEAGQLDALGSAIVHHLVHRRANGAARRQHVVHEEDRAVVHIKVEVGAALVLGRAQAAAKVVAVERCGEGADGRGDAGHLADEPREAIRQGASTAQDAQQGKGGSPFASRHCNKGAGVVQPARNPGQSRVRCQASTSIKALQKAGRSAGFRLETK
jgi:hypothetical protein